MTVKAGIMPSQKLNAFAVTVGMLRPLHELALAHGTSKLATIPPKGRYMLLSFEERHSDSPFVDRIFRTHSERAGSFSSLAVSHWEMCVTRYNGKITLTVRGPQTRATPMTCEAGGDWLGIWFRLGAYLPQLPASKLVDGKLDLPRAGHNSFWLRGSAWPYPDYECADTFVNRLVREGLLVRDPLVEAALQGQLNGRRLRTAQRHFLRANGLTYRMIRCIERARYALVLLREGASISDTVYKAGYFDQAHLTKSLKQLIGQTPAQVLDRSRSEQMSYLYEAVPVFE